MRVSLVIPAYNEVARIGTTMAEAIAYFEQRRAPAEIIVVADGTDGTRDAALEVASEHRATGTTVRVIGSTERRGKGRGVREGVELATGDIIGFTDADNKTPITEFDKVAAMLETGHDLVIGSRALGDSQIEQAQRWYRRWGSMAFGVFLRASIGLDGIIDTQCGFKFFRRQVARDLFSHQVIDGYMFDVEILFVAQQRGYSIGQVPIRWRDDADSRLRLVVGNMQNTFDVLMIRWHHRAKRAALEDTSFPE
jgi:dolichyl-phosphate beta-glucosyltransferase